VRACVRGHCACSSPSLVFPNKLPGFHRIRREPRAGQICPHFVMARCHNYKKFRGEIKTVDNQVQSSNI